MSDHRKARQRHVQHASTSSPTPVRQSAFDLYAEGKLAAALATAEIALRAHRQDVDLLNLAAYCHGQLGNPQQALDLWQQALRIKPDYADAYFNIGNFLKQLGLVKEAEAALRQALHFKPNHADFHNNLGNLLKEQGRLDEAETIYRQALHHQPDHADLHANLGVLLKKQARFEASELALRQALRIRPDHANALYNLGNLLQEQNRLAESAEAYQQALHHHPNHVDALNNLGSVLHKQHNFAAAETTYRQALQIRPEDADICNNLANLLKEMQAWEAAEALYRQALRSRPNQADLHSNLGVLLKKQARYAEAEHAFRQALAIRPDFAHIHYNLGTLLQETQRFAEAESAYRQTLLHMPDHADAHNNLGNILKIFKRYDEAEAAYRQAMLCRNNFAEALSNLGSLLQDMQRFDEAEAAYRQALHLQPDNSGAHNNLGVLLLDVGQPDAAILSFRQAIAIQPNLVAAHRHLAFTKRFKQSDPDLLAIEKLLSQEALSDGEMAQLHYAIAKAKADLGTFDEAFSHYLQGARLKRREFDYHITEIQSYFNAITLRCTARWIETHARKERSGPIPVFIVGMPRSGTTLVEQILASHPLVHASGELEFFRKMIDEHYLRPEQTWPDWLESLSTEELAQLGQKYLQALTQPAQGKKWITDKMPSNFQYLGLIVAALPQARILHVQRDAADTCLSCFTNYFTHGQAFSYDLTELGMHYRAYAGLMDHWRSALPPNRMWEIRYEQLIANPEPMIRDLLAFCGLTWHPACREFYHTKRPIQTASALQVRQPLYQTSVQRWRVYQQQLAPLFAALGPWAPPEWSLARKG
ncbi:MAG: tetratricopeptide repeat protein [Magnetococcales bacterium]|nr:tetratricopeptide repeat protein [Magnetococcales bacterium]